jgi:hypothetical protein
MMLPDLKLSIHQSVSTEIQIWNVGISGSYLDIMFHFPTMAQIDGKEEEKRDCENARWEAVHTKGWWGVKHTDGTWFWKE